MQRAHAAFDPEVTRSLASSLRSPEARATAEQTLRHVAAKALTFRSLLGRLEAGMLPSTNGEIVTASEVLLRNSKYGRPNLADFLLVEKSGPTSSVICEVQTYTGSKFKRARERFQRRRRQNAELPMPAKGYFRGDQEVLFTSESPGEPSRMIYFLQGNAPSRTRPVPPQGYYLYWRIQLGAETVDGLVKSMLEA